MGVGALRPVHAADLTVSFSGTAEVMVELVGANAAYNNSLAVQASGAGITAPGIRIRPAPENPLLNSSGCNLAPTGPLEADAGGFMAGATFPNVVVLSDRKFPPPSLIPTQRGCRVILDRQTGASSYSTTFSGTVTFRFYMCSQIDEDANCDYIWSSDPGENTGQVAIGGRPAGEHMDTDELVPGTLWEMRWEDQTASATDGDFDDLVVRVRLRQDTDGDGLFNDMEGPVTVSPFNGVDTNLDGVPDTQLPGSNDNQKNIYVRLDYMSCGATGTPGTNFDNAFCPPAGGSCATDADCGYSNECVGGTCYHAHKPSPDVLAALTSAFNDAPSSAVGGNGPIILTVELGNRVPHARYMTIRTLDGGCGDPTCTTPIPPAQPVCTVCDGSNTLTCVRSFDEYKTEYFSNTSHNWKRVAYHYGIIGHSATPAPASYTGCGEQPGNDLYVAIANPDVNTDVGGSTADMFDTRLAGTIMHELGHNLWLAHGGNPLELPNILNNKVNYPSVMNYLFQTDGIKGVPDRFGRLTDRIDYSFGTLGSVDENNSPGPVLSESVDFWPAGVSNSPGYSTQYSLPLPTGQTRWKIGVSLGAFAPYPGAKNWDNDGAANETHNGDLDINGSGATNELLTDFNDWMNLRYEFQSTSDYEDGVHNNSPEGGELTYHVSLPPISDAGPTLDGIPAPDGAYSCELGGFDMLDGSASFDQESGSIASFEWHFISPGVVDATGAMPTYSCDERLGTFSIYLTVTDNDALKVIDPATVMVSLNAGADQNLECTSPSGATVTLGAHLPSNGAITYAWFDNGIPIGSSPSISPTLSLGTHTILLSASDDYGVTLTDTLTVIIADTTPPVIEALDPTPRSLWPPNHDLIDTTVAVTVFDTCDPTPTCKITNTASNEPLTGCGSGNHSPDTTITGALSAQLRAERCGTGDGRVYTITVECTDDSGNASSANTTVQVNQQCSCH